MVLKMWAVDAPRPPFVSLHPGLSGWEVKLPSGTFLGTAKPAPSAPSLGSLAGPAWQFSEARTSKVKRRET